jgi:hypothetical protein
MRPLPGQTAASTPAAAIKQAQEGEPGILFTTTAPLAAGHWYPDGSDGQALLFAHVSNGHIDSQADVDPAAGGGWIYTGVDSCS